ncbi:hypothetical protein [Actinosynnema sp. NPDC023587]|uniref:hypothetical protein n=1 Tax=Actinosynnema sp. NPDC023587 TaxID=3154695 RepID=UPI0033D32F62
MTDSGVVTRFAAGSLRAREYPAGPTATFPVEVGAEPVGRVGAVLWRLDFGPVMRDRYPASADRAFPADGEPVWLYRPDVMAGRGAGTDEWPVLDAATGAVRARAALGGEGHGGRHLVHPDGVHVPLGDGSRLTSDADGHPRRHPVDPGPAAVATGGPATGDGS